MASDVVNHLNVAQTAIPVEQGNTNAAVMTSRGMQASQAETKPVESATEAGADKPIEDVVEVVNDYMQNVQRQLNFSIEKDTGRTVIRVMDSATNELVRQIPSEEFLVLAKALEKAKGILLQVEV